MARDTKTENWLNVSGVEWEYLGSVDLVEIDEKRSGKNMARFQAYNEAHAEEMAILYADGIRFPAPVAYRGPDGYVYIDGNHRHGMRKLVGDKATDMYVVKTKDAEVIESLTRSANVLNGLGSTEEERIESAKHIVKTYGRTAVDVARIFGLPASRLTKALEVDEVKATLRQEGIDPAALPNHALNRLGAIHNMPVRAEAARAIKLYSLTTDETNSLVKDIRQLPSEKSQLAYLNTFGSKPEMVGRKAKTRNGRTHITLSEWAFIASRFEQLCRKFEGHSLTQLGITTEDDVQQCAKWLKRLERVTNERFAEWRKRADGAHSGSNGRSSVAPLLSVGKCNS